jgi:hypothetical protein
MPEPELPSLSTAYVPTSPAPATGDNSSSLVPARAPPPSAIIGEYDRALSLRPNGLTPHLLPHSPTLQGHTVDVIHHRSCLATVERLYLKHPPPPPRRTAFRVSSTPTALPGALPVAPTSSLTAPCHWPATTEPLTSAPPRRHTCDLRAVTAP